MSEHGLRRSPTSALWWALCCHLLLLSGCVHPTGSAPAIPTAEESAARWKSCAGRMYPEGVQSESDLQAQFERPQNIEQMLQNLKLAADRDWVLQPHFYDKETLLKFFNGSAVTLIRHEPDPLAKGVEVITVGVDSQILPNMTLRVGANCWLADHGDRGSHAVKNLSVGGNLHIYGGRIPGMSLRAIRGVLGQETENRIETGVTNDGPDYVPQNQGFVVYADRAKQKLTGLAIGTTFAFALRPPPQPGEAWPKKIMDDDVVQAITLSDDRQRILED